MLCVLQSSKLKFDSHVGGGAFLIPYIIVLFVIGKPMYYLESYLGQFMSQSSIKIWEVNPAFRGELNMFKVKQMLWILIHKVKLISLIFAGVGAGQLVSSICVITYYSSLVALTVYYFFASFSSHLPWSQCQPEWGPNCVDSKSFDNSTFLRASSSSAPNADVASSSEMYFLYVFHAHSLHFEEFFLWFVSFFLDAFQKSGFESEARYFRWNRWDFLYKIEMNL